MGSEKTLIVVRATAAVATARTQPANARGLRSLALLAVLLAANPASAETEETFTLQSAAPAGIEFQSVPVLFAERLAFALDRRADNVFADRLKSFNMVRWSLALNASDNDDFRDRTASAAQGALSKSIMYGFRDSIAESPFMLWLEERQATIAAFLRDSIDSVEEEAVSPLNASYGLVERSWWRNVRKSGALRFGLRPFRTSPYAFTSFAVRDNREVLFLGHIRYYYDKLADHKFELAASLPLAYGYVLDFGTSYRFGVGEDPARMAVKLFKELKIGGIAHLGLEMRERPTVLAGLTFRW